MRLASILLICLVFSPCSDPAWAAPIAITNPGFESPDVGGPGEPGNLTSWTFPQESSGVWDINAQPLSFWNVGAPEGDQIAFVSGSGAGASTIAQVLGSTLQGNTIYTLTGQVGHPSGLGATVSTVWTAEMLAGGSVLVSESDTGPDGSFTPFQLVFDSSGSALIGQSLEIRLTSNQPHSQGLTISS